MEIHCCCCCCKRLGVLLCFVLLVASRIDAKTYTQTLTLTHANMQIFHLLCNYVKCEHISQSNKWITWIALLSRTTAKKSGWTLKFSRASCDRLIEETHTHTSANQRFCFNLWYFLWNYSKHIKHVFINVRHGIYRFICVHEIIMWCLCVRVVFVRQMFNCRWPVSCLPPVLLSYDSKRFSFIAHHSKSVNTISSRLLKIRASTLGSFWKISGGNKLWNNLKNKLIETKSVNKNHWFLFWVRTILPE